MNQPIYGPLDQALIELRRHRSSGAYTAMINYLNESMKETQNQMLNADGNELYELKGLAAGLRDLMVDLIRPDIEINTEHD